jgi:hypothetical protein
VARSFDAKPDEHRNPDSHRKEVTDMDWRTWRVCIAPGDAVIAREGARIVVAAPSLPGHERFVDELLALCFAPGTTEDSDDALRRKVAVMVAQAVPGALPSLGLLSPTDQGLAALLVGDAELVLTNADGTTDKYYGREAALFIDRLVPADVTSVLLTLAGGAAPDLRSNLSEGVVRGSGVLLARGPAAQDATEPPTPRSSADAAPPSAPAEQPEPTTAAEPAATAALDSHSTVSVDELLEEVPTPTFVSISLTDAEEDVEPAEMTVVDGLRSDTDHVPHVQGIVCSRGHFNDPTSLFCALCGISMVQQTHHLVTGVRPPLGVVVLDDGTVYALTTDYVVGREPEHDPTALSGKAVPLTLDDPDLAMSRVHARIMLDGWEVRIEDAHSANGTFVAPTPDAAWTRLEPGLPTTIVPGTRVTMGGRTLVFESHQKS